MENSSLSPANAGHVSLRKPVGTTLEKYLIWRPLDNYVEAATYHQAAAT